MWLLSVKALSFGPEIGIFASLPEGMRKGFEFRDIITSGPEKNLVWTLFFQGWLALMSNLCESRAQIDKKAERFFSRYERLKTMRLKAESVVQDFDNVLLTLHQVRILKFFVDLCGTKSF